MSSLCELITQYHSDKIALYGIGTETERFLEKYANSLSIVGLMDGFRNDGEIFGYPIISMNDVVENNVKLIIVVARPGSCKAITKRIGEFCSQNDIALYDVRGKNLLNKTSSFYKFSQLEGINKNKIEEKILASDVVCFDLEETLITRSVLCYEDLFELLDIKLREMGIVIPNFKNIRINSEKKSATEHNNPTLIDIYKNVLKESGISSISENELANIEWQIDYETIVPRRDVCDIYRKSVLLNKIVLIITYSYYDNKQLDKILSLCGLHRYDNIICISRYDMTYSNKISNAFNESYPGKKIFCLSSNIEDNSCDIECCHIYSGVELYNELKNFEVDKYIKCLSDRIKIGLFISELFNSPFWFEEDENFLSISNAAQIGFLLCAPMITDFVLWMNKETRDKGYHQILFCARDGYLPIKLYKEVCPDDKAVYFLSSRTSAIRAGIENEDDIDYVDNMKYSGSPENALKARFGIDTDDITKIDRKKEILFKASNQRINYKKYIEKFAFQDDCIGMFDFVAKGTTQMFLQKLFEQHIRGFYFLQLEPEFMADKMLDIVPFYSDEEKNSSAIFDNYYILETILTSPEPQLVEFDDNGEGVFDKEKRSESNIQTILSVQSGIEDYFKKFLKLIPESERVINKSLDEKLLSMVNNIKIDDAGFLDLKVEDPFFGRMTDIKEVIG